MADTFVITSFLESNAGEATEYMTVASYNQNSGTEANRTVIIPIRCILRRIDITHMSGDFDADNCVVTFRDDAADVTGSSITIPFNAADGDTFTSGTIAGVIAAGSKICYKGASGGTSGSMQLLALATLERVY